METIIQTNAQKGTKGEHFVASELSKKGFTVFLMPRNAEAVDIIAIDNKKHKLLGIQVKTRIIDRARWMLNEKSESLIAENLYYVFVKMGNEQNSHEYHIVPSEIVSKIVKEKYNEWIKEKGKKPEKGIRFFKDEYIGKKYKNKWDLLRR